MAGRLDSGGLGGWLVVSASLCLLNGATNWLVGTFVGVVALTSERLGGRTRGPVRVEMDL